MPARRRRRHDRPHPHEADPRSQPPRPLRRRRAGRRQRLAHQRTSSRTGYHYAPDPSSQGACTIGGNVATNSGGPHTLKYGVTVNHVLGVELVLPDGRVVTLGGPTEDTPGYDLTGVIVGSEGTFGVVTKVWVRLTPQPGGVPHAARRLRDRRRRHQHHQRHHRRRHRPRRAGDARPDDLSARSRRRSTSASRSTPGRCSSWRSTAWKPGLQDEADRIEAIAKKNNAREVRKANTEAERLLLWKAASRRSAPSAGSAPELLHAGRRGAADEAAAHPAAHPGHRRRSTSCGIGNVFHAGDGNIHPILLFDERDPRPGEARCWTRATRSSTSASTCGGSVTGEHGIGVEKIDFMPKLFTAGRPGTDGAAADRVQPGRAGAAPARCCRPPAGVPSRRASWARPSPADAPRCERRTSLPTPCVPTGVTDDSGHRDRAGNCGSARAVHRQDEHHREEAGVRGAGPAAGAARPHPAARRVRGHHRVRRGPRRPTRSGSLRTTRSRSR